MEKVKRKVLLQLIDSLYRGGAQKVVVDITKLFPEFEHIVCYWADEEDFLEELRAQGVKVFKVPFKNFTSLLGAFNFLRKIVKENEVDIIHSHMFTFNIIARMLKSSNVKVISTYHGEVFPNEGFKTNIMKLLEKASFNRSDTNIAVSDYVRTDLVNHLGVNTDTIKVVHNYAEENQLNSFSLVDYFTSPLKLVATSNNHPYKNYPLLIEAVSRFSASEIELDIYGSNMDSIKELVNSKGVENIHFKGSVTNLPQILPNYHIYIATSNSGEGFSLSMLEAMNCGMAIISSDIPQFVEAVGTSGILFKNNSVSGLIEALNWALKNRSSLKVKAEELKKRSEIFNKHAFVSKMLNIYLN